MSVILEIVKQPCPDHKPIEGGYFKYEDKITIGAEQRQCPACLRWYFRGEFGRGWTKARRIRTNFSPSKSQTMALPSRKEMDKMNDNLIADITWNPSVPASLSIIVLVKSVETSNGKTKLKFAYGMGSASSEVDKSDLYKPGQILKMTWKNGRESGLPVVEILNFPD